MRFIAPKRALFFGAALATALCLLVISSTSSAFRRTVTQKFKSALSVLSPAPVKPVPAPVPDTSTSSFRKLVVKNLGPVVNSSSEDFGPTITADGRTMYFVSRRSGGQGQDDFWVTHSPENDDTTWFAPMNLAQINLASADGAASIAADGQTIYFATNRNTTESNDVNIWVATLEGKDWKNIHEVGAPVNTTKWESQPSISPDGKKLFFASNRGGNGVDIFVSHQLADGRWTEPVNLGSKINTKGYDASPFIAADGTTLYFASDGHGGEGGKDIFFSEFKGPSDTDWTEPIALPPPINTKADEMFLTVPASGNVLFFASNRTGGSGGFDIYVATNPPKPRPTLVLRGTCFDSVTQERLGAKVLIVDEQTHDTVYYKDANSSSGEYLCVLSANAKGEVGGTYLVSATEPNHFPYPPTRVNIPLREDTSRIVTHDIPMNNEAPPIVKWVTVEPEFMKTYPNKYPGFKGLIVKEKQTIELYALLPMVFFDQGVGTLPSRYVLFSSPAETQNFSEDTVTATFNGYYNYLNILGLRLRKNPKTKIGIVGCNSQEAENEKSVDLSRQRAEVVKKYLVEIWGIDPERLSIEARKLPENSTLSTTPEGIQENRRVEIHADDWEIIKPIKREQVITEPDWRTAMFSMTNGLRNDRIKSRQLVISHDGQTWATINDLGDITTTKSPEWNWRSDATHKLPDGESDLTVQMLVTDINGRVVKSNVDATGVRQFTQKMVKSENLSDKTREKYNLILFKYNSSDMGKWNHKILEEYVFERIKPSSDVQVNGYTDILGTPDYNLKLSENRANATKKDIEARIRGNVKTLVAKGYGKTDPLYPNELPEGRYYNRTVQVLIETPINAQ
ncbi:MAG: OmpA family protein [Bacteroidota bacterium]|nr:OmpA family protein [Bacteroidota bacterium]MDP4229909.1 OmpA family protein [Bacteroidota bacterium]MDP4235579.1 OmpA family protein [Bacteroidota bacterium]